MYTFSNGLLKRSDNKSFNSNSNEIIFKSHSFIEPIATNEIDLHESIPKKIKKKYTKINMLKNLSIGSIVNVVGILTRVGLVFDQTTQHGKTIAKRDIRLQLWTTHKVQFIAHFGQILLLISL